MARGLAVVVAIAVSLLAVSGAGGAGAQTPTARRHGRLGATLRRARLSQRPSAARAHRDRRRSAQALIDEKVLEAPFDVGPDLTWRPRLVSHVDVHEEAALHADVPHSSRRALERWCSGHRGRLSSSPYRAAREYRSARRLFRSKVRSVRALDAKTVRVVLRSRFAGWRDSSESSFQRTHSRARISRRSGPTASTTPRRARRSGAGRSSSSAGSAGSSSCSVRNPNYWGPHPAYLDRLVVRFRTQRPRARAVSSEAARSTSPRPSLRGFVAGLRREPGVRVVSHRRAAGWDHFDDPQ